MGGAARVAVPVAFALAVLTSSQAALGQQAPSFDTLRRGQFSNIEQGQVKEWVAKRFDELLASQEPPFAEGDAFRKQMTESVRASDATAAFKDGMATIAEEVFVARYQRANNAPPLAPVPVTYYLLLLREYNRPTAVRCYQPALAHAKSGVRAVAAAGLTQIRDRLSDPQWAALLPDVQRAGVAESDPVVLSHLYALLSVDVPARAAQALPVMLAILDARLTSFEQKDVVPAMAEAEAAGWLGPRAVRSGNNAQLRQDVVLRLGRLLADAAHVYVTGKHADAIKERLERVIQDTEKQLGAVVGAMASGRQLPDVTAAMLAGGATQAEKMTLEVNKWIGTAQSAGVLNNAPLQFPRGLGITRPAPAPPPAETPANPSE